MAPNTNRERFPTARVPLKAFTPPTPTPRAHPCTIQGGLGRQRRARGGCNPERHHRQGEATRGPGILPKSVNGGLGTVRSGLRSSKRPG